MKDLSAFLQEKLETEGSRVVGEKIGLSHSQVLRIANGTLKEYPSIETLQAIADAYGLKLYNVIEMAGADLGLPPGKIIRISDLSDAQVRTLIWQWIRFDARKSTARLRRILRWLAGSDDPDQASEEST